MCQLSDKFYSAVRTLAGDGPVKARLVRAYRDNLEAIADEEIPDAIRPRFDLLRAAMRAVRPVTSECPVVASVRKMSARDASRHATQIVAMFSELVRVKTTGERVRLLRRSEASQQAGTPDTPPPDRVTVNRATIN